MPPMPPSILAQFPRDDSANNSVTPPSNSNSKPKESPPNASLIAGMVTFTILVLFIAFVALVPWLKRRREARKEAQKPKPPPPSISQLLDKNSRFDRSFHGHRRAPSSLNLVDPAYMPDRRPPVPNEQPPLPQRDREIPAVHFRDQPEEIRQVQNERPVSHQYYIPPPNAYIENHFPPTPTTGKNTGRLTGRRDDGDPFADQLPSSQLHDVGLDSVSPSPAVPETHWDQYNRGQKSARTPHTNGLTPKSIPGQLDEGSASPLTAYINHLNALGEPPATAPAFSSFNIPPAPRSAGLPYQHQQQQGSNQAYPGSAQPNLLQGPPSFEGGLSSGSDYSDSPSSRPASGARLGVQGYGPGTRGLGYDNQVPHSMPTKGHVSFAHEQTLARGATSRNGAGTALRDKFSPRPSPGMPPRSAGLPSAGIIPSSAHLSANPMKSHFSPMTPDYRQSRMPLPLDALPEMPNSSVAYGFALPASPLSPGDEIVVSPSPYHANFPMNR